MPVGLDGRRERVRADTGAPAFLPYADGIRIAAILAVVGVHSSGMAVVEKRRIGSFNGITA